MDKNSSGLDLLLNISEDIPRKKSVKQKATVEKHFDSLPKIKERGLGQSPVKDTKKKNNAISPAIDSRISEPPKTSSLFKSNPEIPTLKVDKQKGVSEPLFSEKKCQDLNIHPHLVSCLKSRLEVITLTNVQEKTIPIFLSGRDCLVKSCTGSGKTLAYAIPIVQKLQEMTPKIRRCDGIFSLIIVPTRELALQCYQCFSTLTKSFTWIVPGYLIGGEKKKSEKARLRKGINILISTPGRLLDHLDTTACLTLEKIQYLIIDEADRLLEQGFEESVTKIIMKCQNAHQTALLSATLSSGVERLAGISLTDPVHVDIVSRNGSLSQEFQEFALPSTLKQFVIVVPSKLRLTVMSGFIVDQYLQSRFKGLIFMCSQSTVDFHYSLFTSILAPLLNEKGHKCNFFRLHGNMKQEERTAIFNIFRSAKQGILLCTDVAARGLDLPHIDWILQYSPPPSTEIYIHRAGRTARIGKQGTAHLFLLPSESKFSLLLNQHKIQFEETDSNRFLQSLLLIGDKLTCRAKISAEDSATALQTRYEKEVYAEKTLHKSAIDAFCSYIQSYVSYPKDIRDVLPFKDLHLGHVAKSFCLRETPSEIGCKLPKMGFNPKPIRRYDDRRKPQKRKQVVISEFDSGLSELKHSKAPKRRKLK